MKFADRLKFTATGASAATITFGAAVPGFRTLAQIIADGTNDPQTIKVGDTGVPFTIDDGAGNKETSLFTVTSATVLTRTSVRSSSAGGATPATFTGATLNVFSSMPADFASRLVIAAAITGIYAVGETLTAAYPPDTIGSIQFVRTLLVAPFTRTPIAAAVANAVNSLTYKVTVDDANCRIDVDCSNQVSTVTGGAVPAGAVVSTTFRSIYTMDLSDNTTYNNRVAVRDSLRTSIIIRNKNAYPLQYSVSTSPNAVRSSPGNYVRLDPGQEVYATGIDQYWVQPFVYTTESLTSFGTTATVKLTNHGLVTGQVISMFSVTPSDYRWGGVITVIDANTFTYQTTLSNLAAATVQGKFVLTYLTAEIELQGTL
jgi:hypothetical protein